MDAKQYLKQLAETHQKNRPVMEFIGLILLAANDYVELSAKQEEFLSQLLLPENLHARRDHWHAMQIAVFINTCAPPMKPIS